MNDEGRILRRPKKVLVIDVGGAHVEILMTGKCVPRTVNSGPTMTARKMVDAVKCLTIDWSYEAASIGYPGPVLHGRPGAEPKHLGGGWIGFDFERAFGRSVRVEAFAQGKSPATKVRDFMRVDAVAVTPGDTILTVGELMNKNDLLWLPVVESKQNRRFIGIIRPEHVLHFIVEQSRTDRSVV